MQAAHGVRYFARLLRPSKCMRSSIFRSRARACNRARSGPFSNDAAMQPRERNSSWLIARRVQVLAFYIGIRLPTTRIS